MMLYPSVFTLIKGDKKCRYSLVLAVAKKAREISDDADEKGEPLTEKPVSLAIKSLEEGEFDYREPTPAPQEENAEIIHKEGVPVLELDNPDKEEKEDK